MKKDKVVSSEWKFKLITPVNASDNRLPITGSPIPDVDVEAPIRNVDSPSCEYYSHEYGVAAKNVESANPELAKLYNSFGILCSFFPNYHDVAEPYRPMWIMDGKRALVPDDLSEPDLDTVALLSAKTKDAALRARLGDILWVRRRDHKAAKQAVYDYVDATSRLLTLENWVNSIELFRRALQLGAVLGRRNEAWQRSEKCLLDALTLPLTESEPFYACHLLEIANQMEAGDPLTLAKQAGEQAARATRENDPRRSREYRLLEADFHRTSKNTAAEAVARLSAAETYIQDAEACLLRNEPSYLAASSFLAQGIEALRQANADTERVKRLRKRLADYQKQSLSEMRTFGVEVDLKEPAEQIAQFVTTPDFREALKRLALGVDLVSVVGLREEVLKHIKEFPLMHILAGGIVDQDGRVIEKTGSVLGATGADAEAEIEARMFQHAARYHWSLRASGVIEPARFKIWHDHHPRPLDFAFLVRHNPPRRFLLSRDEPPQPAMFPDHRCVIPARPYLPSGQSPAHYFLRASCSNFLFC